MTENPCKDIHYPNVLEFFCMADFLRDLANSFDVSYEYVPGVKEVKIVFNDSQKLSFDPFNVDMDDLIRRVGFWSTKCKSRDFASSISASRDYIEKFAAEARESRKIARKLALNHAYGKLSD